MDNKEVWDNIYESGHSQKAPWDVVVSYVYRNKPKEVANNNVKILEIGCGTASNLLFLAQQGFDVSGIDISSKAIDVAKERFSTQGLSADLNTGSFEKLDFADNSFDIVIDRAALTCVGKSLQQQALTEVSRVMKQGAKFLYTPYANTHSSCDGQNEDGLVEDITKGTLQGVGSICFMNEEDIKNFFPDKEWQILSIEYETRQDILKKETENFHASWRVIVEKK